LGLKNAGWVKPGSILSLLTDKSLSLGYRSYQDFVEKFADNPEQIIKKVVIDD